MKLTDKNNIKHCFLCEFCRNICEGRCFEHLVALKSGEIKEGTEEYEEWKDLLGGRKNIIKCLGPYCPTPCKFQEKEYTPYRKEDGIQPLLDCIQFLLKKDNSLLINK